MYGEGLIAPQRAVDLERAGVRRQGQPLRQDNLNSVAGDNVLARPFHRPHELLAPHVRRHSALAARDLGRPFTGVNRERLRQPLGELIDAPGRLTVRRLHVAVETRVAHDLYPVLEVVEDKERVREHEDRLRQALRVGRGRRKPLEVTRRLVRQVADRAAVEPRQARQRYDAEASQLPFDLSQRVARASRRTAQHSIRLRADEAVASQALSPLDAFEQERVLPARDLQIGRNRRFQVRRHLPEDGQQVAPSSQRSRLLQAGLVICVFHLATSMQTKNPSS